MQIILISDRLAKARPVHVSTAHLVAMMVLRPEGLLPERRRKLEFTDTDHADESVYEASAL